MIFHACTECGTQVSSPSGRKTACGNQGIPDTCAWIRQRRSALKHYHTHKDTPKYKIKAKAISKRKSTIESDWCDYSTSF